MRDGIGRVLCFLLGLGYAAGLTPLFEFGETAGQIWSVAEQNILGAAEMIGLPSWLAVPLLGPFAVGSPLAFVWLVAGKGIRRFWWLLSGASTYFAYWIFG